MASGKLQKLSSAAEAVGLSDVSSQKTWHANQDSGF